MIKCINEWLNSRRKPAEPDYKALYETERNGLQNANTKLFEQHCELNESICQRDLARAENAMWQHRINCMNALFATDECSMQGLIDIANGE